MNIKVKYFSDDTPRLTINPKGDLIDLYAARDAYEGLELHARRIPENKMEENPSLVSD